MSTSSVLVSVATIAGIWALFALGLNIKFGYTGLLDFGHVAFFLVGAYTAALLVMPPAETQQFQEYLLGWNLPARLTELTGLELMGGVGWLIALIVATVVAGIFGLLVALPAIRLREDYLAIALLGISVIAKRTVQTETWLANGPDALRGYDRPMIELFPLPGTTFEAFVLFGMVVFVFWSAVVYLLSQEAYLDAGFNPTSRSTAVNSLFGVLTLGFGYAAARRARTARRERAVAASLPSVFGAGLLAGALATAMASLGFASESVLLFVGTVSLFAWAYAGLATVRHFDTVTRTEALVGLGLAIGLFAVFVPAGAVDRFGGGNLVEIGAVLVTVGLLIAYIAGTYYLLRGWSARGTETSALSMLGIVGVWIFVLRYFVMGLGDPLRQGDVAGAAGVLAQDLLFLVWYPGGGLDAGLWFNYSRFLFALTVAALAAGYVLTEVTVRSPFGRVLKAIREDEDVAMALGKNTFSYKVQSMILGSAMAGLAGGLVAIYYGSLTFRLFDPLYTFFMFLIVVIGGTANNKGVILGAGLYWAFVQGSNDIAAAFPTGSAKIAALRIALLGALFIVILYYRPEGIWGEERMIEEAEEG